MKIPYFIKSAGAGFVVAIIAFFGVSSVTAGAPGQIEGGDIYRVANLTTGAGFADPASAKACDMLEYKVRLYNPGPSPIHNVQVRGSLTNNAVTQNISTITASASDANPAATNDTATVNLTSAQKLSYVAGSTQLLDQQDNLVRGLPDGLLVGSGIAIGDLGDSQIEFVQFKVNVGCPSPPPPPTFACTELNLQAEPNRTVKITSFATTQSGGATYKTADIDWGDQSSPLTIAQPIGQTHQYAKDGTFTVQATAHFDVNGQDQTAGGPGCAASVTFKPNTPPPPTFACTELNLQAEPNRTVKITSFATTQSGGATYKTADIDWGDQSSPLTIAQPIGQTHQYAKDGTFTVQATAHFDVNGQDQTAGGPGCAASVTFNGTTPPVITPPTTTPPSSPPAATTSVSTPSSTPISELVNTGPGSVAAVFGIVTILGAVGYYYYMGRRLSPQ